MLERLGLISLGRASGFSLDEIAMMFAPDGKPRIDRRMLAAKVEELDRTIHELIAMRNGLQHAAACRAPSHMELPDVSSPSAGSRIRSYWRSTGEVSQPQSQDETLRAANTQYAFRASCQQTTALI